MLTPFKRSVEDQRLGRSLGALRGVARAGTIASALCAVSIGLIACGSGAAGSATVAEKASTAAEEAKTAATEARAESEPSPTRTVAVPAQTRTVEKTVTNSVATSGSVTVQATPTTTTMTTSSDDGGLEWWAWALIVLAVGGAVTAAFAIGRRRHSPLGDPDPVVEPTTTPDPRSPGDTPPA